MCSKHCEVSLLKGLGSSMHPTHPFPTSGPQGKSTRPVTLLEGLVGVGGGRKDRRKGLLLNSLAGKQSKVRRGDGAGGTMEPQR